MPTFTAMQNGYASMFAKMEILPSKRGVAEGIAARLIANRSRYESVSRVIGCPWWFIAIIHNLESNANFARHLHNGDPLTARTSHVPAGRPAVGEPPFTWEVSAIDALRLKELDKVADWKIPRCLFEWERYNGWGYLGKINSPYLWNFSNLAQKGKYVADHVWDPNATSEQCGAAVILRALTDMKIVKGEDTMSELKEFLKQFSGLAPTLATVIAGPVAGIAVKAIAEALTDEPGIDTGTTPVPADAKVIVDKLESSPITKVVSVLQAAEAIIRTIQLANTPPVSVALPIPGAPIIAPVGTEVTTTTTSQPENNALDGISVLDRVFPSLVGWKTYIAIAIYVLGNVAAIFVPTMVTPEVMQAVTWIAGGIGGAGLIEKMDRWLSILKPTVKTTTVSTK